MDQEIKFLLYSLPGDDVRVQVVVKGETLWCTQKAMASLFGCTTDNIGAHLKNIHAEGELKKEPTTEKISVVQQEGGRVVTRAEQTTPKTTWKNAPDGRVLKMDVTVAKNYLEEEDIRKLERAVTAYFDYIEMQIERHNAFTMEQFAASVDKSLTFNDYKILPDLGQVSKEQAEAEYDIFNRTQRIDSDFDKQVRAMIEK